MRKGYKFTDKQRNRLRQSHLGQLAWNKGLGGCKKGHDPNLYVPMPSGVSVCLGCKRENGLKYRERNRKTIRLKGRLGRYQLSIEGFQEIWESQNGKCPICKTDLLTAMRNRKRDGYRIDHDHKDRKVRGFLCHSCNTGLGLFKESTEILANSIIYLIKNNE